MNYYNSYEDLQLLGLISEGDKEAFTTLFGRYRNKVFHIAKSLTDSSLTAEDILQEVFLRIWLRRKDLATITNFSAYLAIMTRHVLMNALRSQERSRKRELVYGERVTDLSGDELVNRLQDKEYNNLLNTILEKLPPQQMAVLRMIKLQGYTRDEAAARLGISPETVKKHLERALKSVRTFLLIHLDDTLIILAIIYFL